MGSAGAIPANKENNTKKHSGEGLSTQNSSGNQGVSRTSSGG
jgi:hypothetical protein